MMKRAHKSIHTLRFLSSNASTAGISLIFPVVNVLLTAYNNLHNNGRNLIASIMLNKLNNKCVSKTHISPYAQLIPGGVVHGPLKGSKSYMRCL